LNNNKRYQLFFGGSSSGKSYFLAQRCIIDILKGGRNYLICRNNATAIRKSVFNEIKKAITFFKANDLFTINKTEMIITCVNGYQIMFVGLDDSLSIPIAFSVIVSMLFCFFASSDKNLLRARRWISLISISVVALIFSASASASAIRRIW